MCDEITPRIGMKIRGKSGQIYTIKKVCEFTVVAHHDYSVNVPGEKNGKAVIPLGMLHLFEEVSDEE